MPLDQSDTTKEPEQAQVAPGENAIPAEKDDTGLDAVASEKILAAIRDNQFLSGIVDGRDVSLVYIDRHQIQNYFGPEPAGERSHRPVDSTSRPQRRIGELVINPLPSWERERTAAVYLEPSQYEDALRLLRVQGLLVLHGPQGTGKRATAIRLLNGLTFSDETSPIYELNPGLRLVDLRPDELPDNTALLLESADGRALENLGRFQLDALYNALNPEGHNNGLVVVTEQVPTDFPLDYGQLVFKWQPVWSGDLMAAQREILARHVRYFAYYEPDYVEVIQPKVEPLCAQPLLDDLLGHPLAPRQLAELAELLLPVLRGELELEGALARFGQRAYRDVERWFDEDHPPDLENLLIATAVFNGAPYSAVNQAAQALETFLQPEPPETSQEKRVAQPTSRFAGRNRRQTRLAAIHASIVPVSFQTHYGEVFDNAIELKNSAWQEAVLRLVWQDSDFGQRILDWLVGYGSHGDHYMRTRAAAAIGALASNSFAAIESKVLRSWAASPDENSRRSAAQVLGITIWDERQSGPTAHLLHYWASQRDQPRWQWTAAAAYAGLAGPRYLSQTLADLKLIAANSGDSVALLEPIFRTMLNLYATARHLPERRLALLEELDAWSNKPLGFKRERGRELALRRTALLSFWIMLWPEKNDPVWQLLLSDIGVPGPAQALAIRLMRNSLNFRQRRGIFSDGLHPRKMALDGIRDLILFVSRGHDPDQLAYLEGLLTALMAACRSTGSDEVALLRYHAQGWEEARREALQLVEILLAE